MKTIIELLIVIAASVFVFGCTSAKNHSEQNAGAAEPEPPVQPTVKQEEGGEVEVPANLTENEKKVFDLLRGFERLPQKQDFIALDKKEAAEALMKFTLDKSLKMFIRARALASLSYFGGPDAETTIKTVLTNLEEPLALRRTAIQAFGETAGEQSLDILLPMLNDEDKFVREAVILATKQIQSAKVKDAYKARFEIEKEEFLKKELDTVINLPEPEAKEVQTK